MSKLVLDLLKVERELKTAIITANQKEFNLYEKNLILLAINHLSKENANNKKFLYELNHLTKKVESVL